MTDPKQRTWRAGRKLGRTLYCGDICVGMVDTPEIARAIVEAMNGIAAGEAERATLIESLRRSRCGCESIDCVKHGAFDSRTVDQATAILKQDPTP